MNVTVTEITETRIVFSFFNPTANKDHQLIINGSQLAGVFADNVSITEGSVAETSTWNFDATVLPFFGQTNTIVFDNNVVNGTITFPSTTETDFAIFGRSLEGNYINNFTSDEFGRVQGLAEHYNLLETNIDNIINFTTIDGQKAYEIAGKLKLGLDFTPDANLTDAGQAYVDGIGNATSFAEIFDKIEQRIRDELGSGSSAGDNPNHGERQPET